MEGMFESFDESYLQKAYAHAQDHCKHITPYRYETTSVDKKSLPPGFNIAPSEDPSIASLITQEVVEDEDISLLGGASLALDPAEDYISLLGNGNSLVGNDVHPHEDLYLSDSTTEGHIIASKVKQATSLLTLEFNANLDKK